MAWRVVEHDARRWNVSIAAERRANSPQWSLVFAFRPVDLGQRCIWATYPLSAPSRAALIAQAERIPDDAIAALLAAQLD
jgi:hypothetical protein